MLPNVHFSGTHCKARKIPTSRESSLFLILFLLIVTLYICIWECFVCCIRDVCDKIENDLKCMVNKYNSKYLFNWQIRKRLFLNILFLSRWYISTNVTGIYLGKYILSESNFWISYSTGCVFIRSTILIAFIINIQA